MSTDTYLSVIAVSVIVALAVGVLVGLAVEARLAARHVPVWRRSRWTIIAGCLGYVWTIGVSLVLTTILTTI